MDCVGCKQPREAKECVRFKATPDELTQGVASGCPRCSFAFAILDCIKQRLQTTRQLRQMTVQPGKNGYVLLSGFNDPGQGQTIVDIFRKGQGENPFSIHRHRNILPANTGTPETIDAIRSWINECETLHEPCILQRKNSQFHPRRLLDLGNDAIFLREYTRPAKYACLSHCWGANAYATITKTLSSTIDHFMTSGISQDSLTKTFRDAISVCRVLGISHLWIDSFCIIQDSPDDWRDQAAQMADIYEHAFVTIAASWASDGSKGLFANVPPIYYGDPVPGYPDTYARQMMPEIPSASNRNDPNWPLLNRGWVYQEMRLSPRILHFCYNEAAWRCQASHKNQGGRNATLVDYGTGEFDNFMPEPYAKLEEDPVALWHDTVEDYSGRLLTFETDRMIALSAVTQRMERLRLRSGNDRYLAGLWERTLAEDLNWMIVPAEISRTPKNPAFPSWSWAAVASRVMYPMKTEPLFVTVRNVHYESSGPGYLGEFSEAPRITLEAPLIECGHDADRFRGKHLWSADRWNLTEEIEVTTYIPDYSWDGPPAVPEGVDSGKGWAYIVPLGVRRKEATFYGLYVRKREMESPFYERQGLTNFGLVGGKDPGVEEQVERVIRAVEKLPRLAVTLV